MKISITRALQISFNILIVVFSYATYNLVSHKIKDIFIANDRVLNQQKSELIAKSIRSLIPDRNYVGMRTVVRSALNDPAVRVVRFIPVDGSEGACAAANGESCFSQNNDNLQIYTAKLFYDPESKQPMGAVQVAFQNESTAQIDRTIRMYIGVALLLVVTLFNFMVFFSFRSIRRQIEWSIDAVRRITRGEEVPLQKSVLVEKSQFSSALTNLKGVLQDYKTDIEEASTKAAFGEVAKKVAHDIRDPLLALDSTLPLLEQMPEEKRTLTKKAIARIHGIANDLIQKSKATAQEGATAIRPLRTEQSVELLSSLIDSIISEKRMRFRSKENIEIRTMLEEKSYGLFVGVSANELHRVLSNLINNAVEAIGERGTVSITAEGIEDRVILKISDNGCGMPEPIKDRVLSTGGTFNKKGGSGIGLRSAIEIAKSWGGSLDIQSTVGRGTTVTIALPRAQAPSWFIPQLVINPGDTICVLDDEEMAHLVWKYRFKSTGIPLDAINLHHFYTANDIMDWFYAGDDEPKKAICFCDFELLGQDLNGLEVIKLLKIESQSILVTSRYDEPAIREECIKRGIRLIPKTMAGLVPIQWNPEVKQYANASA